MSDTLPDPYARMTWRYSPSIERAAAALFRTTPYAYLADMDG